MELLKAIAAPTGFSRRETLFVFDPESGIQIEREM